MYESSVIGKVILGWVIESCTSFKNISEDLAWIQGEHGNFNSHQIYRALLSTRETKPCFGIDLPFALDVKGGEYFGVWIMVMINVSICCGDQTPSWLPSSPKGEIVGNMMQYVVLDGNLLDDVVLDGNLLMSCLFDNNLFVKNVKMMIL